MDAIKIIYIESDIDINKETAKILKENWNTEAFYNVSDSFPKIKSGEYNFIVVNSKVLDSDSSEFFSFTKKFAPKAHVVVVVDERKMSDRINFTKNGVDYFIGQNYQSKDIELALQEIFFPQRKQTFEKTYCEIHLDCFTSSRPFNGPLFLRLSEEKYIKIIYNGKDINRQTIEKYKERGISHLYATLEDFSRYLEFEIFSPREIQFGGQTNNLARTDYLKYSEELIENKLKKIKVNNNALSFAESVAFSFLKLLVNNKGTLNLLTMVKGANNHSFLHGLMVGLFGVMIAHNRQIHSLNDLFTIFLGGLLHDIGKSSLAEGSGPASKDLALHPRNGMKILIKCQYIPIEVLKITLQHHESCSGNGYPNQLGKEDIHKFSKLISVANLFSKFVVDPKTLEISDHESALEKISDLHHDEVDSDFLESLNNLFSG